MIQRQWGGARESERNPMLSSTDPSASRSKTFVMGNDTGGTSDLTRLGWPSRSLARFADVPGSSSSLPSESPLRVPLSSSLSSAVIGGSSSRSSCSSSDTCIGISLVGVSSRRRATRRRASGLLDVRRGSLLIFIGSSLTSRRVDFAIFRGRVWVQLPPPLCLQWLLVRRLRWTVWSSLVHLRYPLIPNHPNGSFWNPCQLTESWILICTMFSTRLGAFFSFN